MYEQLELETLDIVVVPNDRLKVNIALRMIAPDVEVVGFRLVEDGAELVLEGSVLQVAEFINLWKEKGI